jgi:hypothetical protein
MIYRIRKEERDTRGQFRRSGTWEKGKEMEGREGNGLGNNGIFGRRCKHATAEV